MLALWSLLLASCGAFTELLPVPEVVASEAGLERVDFEELSGLLQFELPNSYPIDVELTRSRWSLHVLGVELLTGVEEESTAFAAGGRGEVRLPIALRGDRLFAIAGELSTAHAIPFTFAAELEFDTVFGTVFGRATVPFTHHGSMPALRVPSVGLTLCASSPSISALRPHG